MDDRTLVLELNRLIQTDIDAVRAYGQSIEAIDDPELRGTLQGFQEDHRRHVTELSAEVRRLGGDPPARRDLMGFAIEGFTAVTSSLGNMAALMAMRSNEELTNDVYDRALTRDLPPEIRALVERNRQDERRHRDWIAGQLGAGPQR